MKEDAIREISAAELQLKGQEDSLKKVHSVLSKAKAKMAQTSWRLRDLRKLLADLEPLVTPATKAIVAPLVSQLTPKLKAAESEYERTFVSELSRAAQQQHVECGQTSGTRFLGPFELRADFDREVAELHYAKQPVRGELPLDAASLAETASTLAGTLLQRPADFNKLVAEFEQAHRVALARDKKPVEGRETRSNLPDVFREMQFIRQDHGRPLTTSTLKDYSLARFAVEVKLLVQSDSNLESAKRFRLETAVIENTKNAKKSVFIPADLNVGYGEGTYFQALVLVTEGR